jgi:SAM-dependent methyltransferase
MYDPLARATNPEYLAYQYADSEKLRIRLETHARYSERPNDFFAWVLERLGVEPGMRVADVGCGPGAYHPHIARAGGRVVGLDYSFGMVSEAHEQARHDGLPVDLLRADAQALPVADGAFDRTMANHMLYHVPDQVVAMRELKRITRPGGRIVMATTAADQNERLIRIHDEAALELGLNPNERSILRFTLDHIDLVRQVFPNVRVEMRRDAFVFHASEPAVRYYASGMVHAVVGEAPVEKLVAGVRRRIDAVIAAEGMFRVPKDAGAFVVDL